MIGPARIGLWRAGVAAAGLAFASAALAEVPKHEKPIPGATLALMAAKNTHAQAPILMRVFKKESELEIWKRARDGRFVHLKTFPICRWSGQLGPKRRQGDRQAPEGFYAVGPKQMNPNSAYYLSFDLGFPNAYDRAQGASGSYLMVHGTCSSAGCYAMTDQAVGEIFALAREAFAGGQAAFQVQAYPFRMTAENLARHRADPNIGFWTQLKEGFDRFEATGEEPSVTVTGGRYAFLPLKDPAREAAARARQADEKARIALLVAEGSASIRTTYADGGQHPSFRALLRRGVPLGEVSRPEALAFAGREVVLTPARPKPPVAVADANGADLARAAAAAATARLFGPFIPLETRWSAFAWTSLAPDGPPAAAPPITGSVRALPPTFAPSRFEVAANETVLAQRSR